jgi:hypothetical protein
MAGPSKGGVVHIPWYATGFRGDAFADALAAFAPVVMRYGAIDYQVFRSRDDRYKFLHTSTWESKLDWERFWEGEDAISFRVNHQGWYQVPLLYVWNDRIAQGGNPEVTAAPLAPATSDSPTVG